MSTEQKPWDRQRGEGAKQYHAFAHYRDMPLSGRSIDAAGHAHRKVCLGKPAGTARAKTWQAWSTQWGWVQRVAAWDQEQDRAVQAKVMKDQVDARARHARMAQAALQVLTLPSRATLEILSDPAVMQTYIEQARATPRGLERLIGLVTSASHSIPGLVDVERLALGMSTESIEVSDRREESLGARIPGNPAATALAIQLLDSIAGTGPGTAEKPK